MDVWLTAELRKLLGEAKVGKEGIVLKCMNCAWLLSMSSCRSLCNIFVELNLENITLIFTHLFAC